jgi:hypothetical protein
MDNTNIKAFLFLKVIRDRWTVEGRGLVGWCSQWNVKVHRDKPAPLTHYPHQVPLELAWSPTPDASVHQLSQNDIRAGGHVMMRQTGSEHETILSSNSPGLCESWPTAAVQSTVTFYDYFLSTPACRSKVLRIFLNNLQPINYIDV